MRILLSAYACRPNAGSEPGCGWNWATHLAAREIDVYVLVASRNRETIEAGLQGREIKNLHFTYVSVPYQWAKKHEGLHYLLWQVEALKAARELARKCEFDLAHHVTYASVHAPTQLWRLGIPVVFGPVGGGQTAPTVMLPYFGSGRHRERLRSVMTRGLSVSLFHRRSLRRMSYVLAANRDTLGVIQALGCENAELMCDTAVSAEYLADRPRSFEDRKGELRLLWVGRMLTRKALALALDSVKEVNNDKNQGKVTLTIAGDGMDPARVRRLIRERDLQQEVFWKGCRLEYAELRSAYANHDAMLFTSLRDSFGSQLLEAMAMGLPIITLDLHGARDFVPDAACLKVPVGRPEETLRNLASAIERYRAFGPQQRDQMSRNGWKFAKESSWTARVDVIGRIYEQVLSKANRPKTALAPRVPVEAI